MLKRISVKGFKSFADPISLDFGPGVNVIVGPNGSGKSNLAEAIIWALGEQRAGKLRAPAMQDILYAGSGERQAAGFAEIALHFEADESGARPEMEVSRRLARSGDAVYRIGHTACRLLDVQEALSTRGLGSDSLAVIRQGQVEAIATSRPAARRAMIDEAAGVGVAKRRRKRAEQKLARIADKLDRARDLAAELTNRARALDRQARAAERAADLEQRIAAVRERERLARAIAAAAALESAEATHRRLAAADAVAVADVEAARRAREDATATRAAATGSLERADAVAQRLRSAGDRIAGRAELAQERVTELESRQERLGTAKADAARRLEGLEEAEREVAAEIAAASRALDAAQAMLSAAEQDEMAARSDEATAADHLRRASADLAAAQTAQADAEHRIERAERAIARADEELAALHQAPASDLERAERRAEIAERRCVRDTTILDAAQSELDEAAADLRTAEQRSREAASAARLLAPSRADDHGPAVLGDGLEVEQGTERAVAAAMGAAAEAFLAADLAEAAEAVAGGVATAMVPVPDRGPGAAPGDARPLLSVVTGCPERTRPYVERLLARAFLVEDLADVPVDADGIFVTLGGTAFVPRTGIVSVARGEWAQRVLHRRALEEARERAGAVEVAAQRVATATASRDGARRRQAATRDSLTRLTASRDASRAAAAALSGRVERLRAEREESERHRVEAVRERAAFSERGLACAGERDVAQAALAVARERSAAAAAELDVVRAAVRDARAAGSALDARAGEVQSAAASARALLGAADVLPAGLELISRAAAALSGAATALLPATESAMLALQAERATFAGAEQALAAAHRRVDGAEALARESRELLHAAAVELRLAQERVAEAGPVVGPVPDEPIDPDTLARELEDLERRRLGIGAVNELAAQERAELTDREQVLTEQIQDLADSSASLAEHLGELDAAVGEGFEATFAAVAARFSEVVGWLFPGGTGRLRLVEPEEEDGEEGVEVEVVPAGKRPRPMSLLSGGERSLIAMAFMLALAMSRPAPFYLLDEVEAALDDANLRRFLGVLRRLAGETQFIVITHQQPTVEVADTLFGVTMGGQGVSQVVSRRLAQSVEGPARPYVRRQLRLVGS